MKELIFLFVLAATPADWVKIQQVMSPAQFDSCGLKKLTPAELARLNALLSKMFDVIMSKNVIVLDDFDALQGAQIYADDETYLGKISNKFDSQSVGNNFGQYGNKFNSESIWSLFGFYGNKFSHQSVYNTTTTSPPKIYMHRKFVAYLTKNRNLSPRVDPDALYGHYARD